MSAFAKWRRLRDQKRARRLFRAAYYGVESGDYQAAKARLEEALSLVDDDPEVHCVTYASITRP
jgi:hypothetical protein